MGDTSKRFRSAITGRFLTKRAARRHPKTSVGETYFDAAAMPAATIATDPPPRRVIERDLERAIRGRVDIGLNPTNGISAHDALRSIRDLLDRNRETPQ